MICLAAIGVLGVGQAAASGWQLQAHLHTSGPRPNVPLLGASCPSKSFCVVVGENDTIASSDDPAGGASKWDVIQPDGEAETDCHSSWVPPCPSVTARRIRGVSCPSTRLCVAATSEGYVYSSHEPDGSGEDWRVADIDGSGRDTHLLDISCPSASLCVAVSGERYMAGRVLYSTNPSGGASAWHETQLDETLDFDGVSCGSPSLCVAVADQGRIVVSTNPTGGPSAWRLVGSFGGPGNLQGVSCTTALCVAGNEGGNLLTSASPAGAASTWDEVSGGSSVQITGISCLPSGQCAAVDNNGDVLTTQDAAAASWSLNSLIPYEDPVNEGEEPLNGLFGVSCASSSFCAIAGADGRIYTSTEPFAVSPSSGGGGEGEKKGRRPRRPRVRIASMHGGFPVPTRHAKAGLYFRFHANGRVRRFLCGLDGRSLRRCRSPKHYRVGVGKHTFRVRAIGLTGLQGPIAAEQFEIQVNRFR